MTVFVDANNAPKKFPRFARGRKKLANTKPTKPVSDERRAKLREYNQAYRRRDPERARQIVRNYRARLLVEYGAPPKPAVCDVCGHPGKKICADHNHDTGRFRGWLCDDCNLTLGKMKDDPIRLRALAAYLEEHNGCLR